MLTSGKVSKALFNKGVYLNENQEADIEEMYLSIPELRSGLEATRGWAFCHPPEVKWPLMGTVASREFTYILKEYYMEFRWKSHLARYKFGILAYYFEKIGEHWIPRIPKRGTGRIRQYWDSENRRMVYQWFWHDAPDKLLPDPMMRFKVWFEPDIDGNYTSPAVAALHTWKMAKIALLSGQRAVHHGSNMPYFLVHQPPKGRPGDEKLTINFGDAEELEMERDAFNRQLEKGYMSRNAVRSSVAEARAANRGLSTKATQYTPILNSETVAEREEREGNGVLDRLVELDDFWNIANAAPPVLLLDPLEYQRRMGQVIAALVDFPVSMVIEQHAIHTGNFDAQVTFARDRMKAIIIDMNDFLTKVILDAERHWLKGLYYKGAKYLSSQLHRPLTEEELIDIHSSVHGLVVEQHCTPLITLEQILAIWEAGLTSQETLAKQASHLTGIPPEDIDVTKLKRTRELEMEKLALEKSTAKQQNTLGEKKLDIDAKKAASAPKKAKTAAAK